MALSAAADPASGGLERVVRRGHRVATFVVVMLAFGAASLVVSASLVWRHLRTTQRILADLHERAQADTAKAALTIDTALRSAMPVAQRAAQEFSQPGLGESEVQQRLDSLAASNLVVQGVGVAYQPFAFNRARRLFAPYVFLTRTEHRRIQIDGRYDYTRYEHGWYRDPLLDGAKWNEPIDAAGQGMEAMYAVPFHRPGADQARDDPAGVAFATVSLAEAQNVIDSLALGTSGYGFVFSAEGRYVVHPQRDLVARRATLFESAWEAGDTTLHSLAVQSVKGRRGLVEWVDATSGQVSWVAYEPIASTGWTLAMVYFEDAFRMDANRERREYFRITSAAAAGLVFIAVALIAFMLSGRVVWLWTLAGVLSLALGGGIVALWYFSGRFPYEEVLDRTKILDAASAEEYLRTYERERGASFTRVPSGVFVKSVQFLSSTNVAVTGYIWQTLPAPAPRTPQFEIVEADAPTVREVSRSTSGSAEHVLWYFSANLRERFDYETYPFDRHDVWLRLRPATITTAVALVPDLGSYPVLNPLARPGVAVDLVLPGWRVLGSYFDYRASRYTTTFGLGQSGQAGPPELYFNVAVARQFLGPFVSNITPMFVAGSMIFALLLISSKRDPLFKYGGFTAKDIILGSAAVFFVIIYQHIALRDALASPRLIYFEYFYFTTYFGLLLVTMNAILFASETGGPFIEFRNNMVPKITFWPAAMLCLFLVTLVVFY